MSDNGFYFFHCDPKRNSNETDFKDGLMQLNLFRWLKESR
jgi:hypothetical protein